MSFREGYSLEERDNLPTRRAIHDRPAVCNHVRCALLHVPLRSSTDYPNNLGFAGKIQKEKKKRKEKKDACRSPVASFVLA